MNDWIKETFFLMPNYKWVGLLLSFFFAALLKSFLKQFLLRLKSSEKIRKRIHGFLLTLFDQPIEKPTSWILTIFFLYTCLDVLTIIPRLEKYIVIFCQVVLFYNFMRLAYLAVEAIGKILETYSNQSKHTLNNQLVIFSTKTLKLLVLVIGFLMALQNFGVNVMSLIAGLGIGGLALALAAQDTAANLFGSITIILDRPFQVGDWIKIGDTEGTVEDVGFRSTRIRTFYNSLVTIPNSTMAKEKIDNLGARDSRRIRHTIGVTYETPEEKIKSFIEQIKSCLAQHPLIIQDRTTVSFKEMGDFNLQILLVYFVNVQETDQEFAIQQEVLFEIMKIAKNEKIEFAYPTETHYLKSIN